MHSTNSYHYQGRAIDVNWPGGGATEHAMLSSIYGTLAAKPHAELMIEDAFAANQHLHYAMARGGIVRKQMLAMMGERGRSEAVLPLESPQGKRALADAMREAGAGGGFEQHLHFQTPPPALHPYLMRAKFAAQASMG